MIISDEDIGCDSRQEKTYILPFLTGIHCKQWVPVFDVLGLVCKGEQVPQRSKELEVDLFTLFLGNKPSEREAYPGDYVQVSIGTRKTVYGAELAVNVDKIISKDEIENNWK